MRDVGFEFLHIEFWPQIRNTFNENPVQNFLTSIYYKYIMHRAPSYKLFYSITVNVLQML